jgi:flagellin-like protein
VRAALRLNRRALSEIVGALMLVLIVVVAATAFSAFAATYQKQLQAEQAIQHDRTLESIDVIRVSPTLNSSSQDWASFNFTVVSLDVNPTVITSLSLNGNPLRSYSAIALNLTTGTVQSITVGAGGQLFLGAREQFNILVDASPGNGSSFYTTALALPYTSFVELELFTEYGNDFKGVFVPPTAIATVSALQSFNNSTPITVPVLDGSSSFQPSNASIVSWSWNVTPGAMLGFGEKVPAPYLASSAGPAATFTISLTVTNSDGLIGFDQITYHRS